MELSRHIDGRVFRGDESFNWGEGERRSDPLWEGDRGRARKPSPLLGIVRVRHAAVSSSVNTVLGKVSD